jgi:DNA-3-methyladenine glycosylase
MSGPAGIAYVYLVYGMYDCVNVVTGTVGSASAVLIRAVEPLEGIGLMRNDRARVSGRQIPDHALASGPGLVGACFEVDRSWTGMDLCDAASPLRLEDDPAPSSAAGRIVAGPRVGVAYAGPDWSARPWRFRLDGHPSVSRPR